MFLIKERLVFEITASPLIIFFSEYIDFNILDLPDPVLPIRNTNSPLFIFKLRSFIFNSDSNFISTFLYSTIRLSISHFCYDKLNTSFSLI